MKTKTLVAGGLVAAIAIGVLLVWPLVRSAQSNSGPFVIRGVSEMCRTAPIDACRDVPDGLYGKLVVNGRGNSIPFTTRVWVEVTAEETGTRLRTEGVMVWEDMDEIAVQVEYKSRPVRIGLGECWKGMGTAIYRQPGVRARQIVERGQGSLRCPGLGF